MKNILFVCFTILCFCQIPFPGHAAVENTGIVKSVTGEVFLANQASKIRAVPNMKLSTGDSIVTGKNSYAGLIFKDDTVVSLGPNSEMAVTDFNFDPANKELSFVAKFLQGTFSFISGQIAKLAPQKVKLETPNATLGVRGTKFIIEVK